MINKSSQSFVYNLFRLWEQVFGRKPGIRLESEAVSTIWPDGTQIIERKFYTLEARLVWWEFLLLHPFHKLHEQLASLFPVMNYQTGAIAFDTALGQDATGANSFSYTVTGANPALVAGTVGANTGEGGDDRLTFTYAAVALTNAIKHNDASYRWNYLDYKKAPATGANTLANTWTGSHFNRVSASSYSGCDQATLLDSAGKSNSASSSSQTVSTTVVATNCWLVGHFVSDRGGENLAAGAGTTLRGAAGETSICDSNGTVSTGSQTLAATSSTAGKWNNTVMSIAPAGGANSGFFNLL